MKKVLLFLWYIMVSPFIILSVFFKLRIFKKLHSANLIEKIMIPYPPDYKSCWSFDLFRPFPFFIHFGSRWSCARNIYSALQPWDLFIKMSEISHCYLLTLRSSLFNFQRCIIKSHNWLQMWGLCNCDVCVMSGFHSSTAVISVY